MTTITPNSQAKQYCSEVCSAANEPMPGTAIQVDVWIMLEYRRAWMAKALDDNLLADATNAWLADTISRFEALGLTARPQFIRRPERTDSIQLYLARDGRLGGVAVESEEALQHIDLVNTPLPRVEEPQYFVCTNAKRDICCAKFGRPTYAALHREIGGRAWQTTHVGGHRYAPNVLALPQSALYGRVMPNDVTRFLKHTERGELAREFLRGQTRYSQVAQIAEHAIDDAEALHHETPQQATFTTPTGHRTVEVGPAAETLELPPSCGKPTKPVLPMIAIKTSYTLLMIALLLPLFLTMNVSAAEPYVPAELKPWVEWVLHPHQNLNCPRDAQSGEVGRCAWVSSLNVDVSSRINFTMQVQVFAASRVELPGSHPHWPTDVRANDAPVTVIGGNTRPSVMLDPGNYRLTGRINWGKQPSSLQLPKHTGIVNLQIDGKQVLRPTRNASRLLLGKSDTQTGKAQRNSLSADVYREIEDTYPMRMITTVELTVAGQPRLVTLGRVLLDGFETTGFESALPARLLPNGDLQIQVEAGEHEVIVYARALGNPEVITPVATSNNWPTQEIWGFAPQRNLRLVELSGAPPIDLSQTAAPFEGDDLRGYLLDTTTTDSTTKSELRFAVKQRGNPTPPPNRFNIKRDIWLKFDGTGFVTNDNLDATINHASRLSANYKLGRVTVNDQDELINSLSSDSSESEPGIELQAGSYRISAISEIDRGELVNATGWSLNSDTLSATFNMPPGWRLLWTRGVDKAPDAWIARWSLWKIFVLVLLTVLAWRFLGRLFTLLLVIATALLMHTAPAIAIVWLLAVALLSAVRHLSHEGAVRVLTLIAWGWLGLTALMVIGESVTHARQALYPQLEHYSALRGSYDSNFSDIAVERAEVRSKARDAIEEVVVTASRGSILEDPAFTPGKKYTEGLQVQTGPGQPQWRWNRATLIWDGPVSAEQTIKLTLMPPVATRIINALVATLLLAVTALMMLALLSKNARNALPKFVARLAPALLLAFVGLHSPDTVAAESATISPELLKQLEARLLEKPECFPSCASLGRADINANNSTLEISLDMQSAERVAVALPTSTTWTPNSVTLNGKPATLATQAAGALEIVLPAGSHSIAMTGSIANLERFEISLPLKPAQLTTNTSDEWQISGLVNGQIARGSLGFDRKVATTTKDETLKPAAAKPFVSITRTLTFDQEWRMYTTVTRKAPERGGFSIDVPLLENEAVLNEDITIVSASDASFGKAALVFGRSDQQIRWTSQMQPQSQLTLTAPPSLDRVESWTLQPSNFWHVDYSGLNPVGDSAERSGPTFQPLAGESLSLSLTKTTPVPGATVTISKVDHTTTIGARQQRQTLQMQTLASQGGTLAVKLSATDNKLVSVTINGRDEPISLIDNVLPLPITPGNTSYQISWLENTPRSGLFTISPATLAYPASNVSTNVEMSRDRWVLLLGGPELGPGILLWGMVLVALILALLIARIPGLPFTATDAALLSLGLSLANLPATLLVAVWVIALRFRGEIVVSLPQQWLKNLLQISTAMLSFLTIITLVASVPFALLGSPDMQVQGNGSTAYSYNWFTDQTSSVLPSAWVLSVPMWVYRAMMLIWSLWLAFALIRWVPWAWQQWSTPAMWYKDPKPSFERKVSPSQDNTQPPGAGA